MFNYEQTKTHLVDRGGGRLDRRGRTGARGRTGGGWRGGGLGGLLDLPTGLLLLLLLLGLPAASLLLGLLPVLLLLLLGDVLEAGLDAARAVGSWRSEDRK